MDAFKAQEIERMRLAGNKPWRDFFDNAESNKMAGITYVSFSPGKPEVLGFPLMSIC